jgi:ribosomal protein S18 acetylase RimI-like enzyme
MRPGSLAFRTDVAIRSLEGASVTRRDDYLVIRTPGNPGFWWGNFLLLAAPPEPGSASRWLARFAAEFPAASHVALGVDTADPAAVVPTDFIVAGLEPERAVVLTATQLREPAHPNGDVQVRPLATGDDWQQSADLGIRCADDEVSADREYHERRAAARQRITEQGHGAWFGAFGDGRLLAQLGLFGTGRGYARYQHVETDPVARRRGLAGTLLWRAARYGFDTLGASTLVIVADPADAAIRLYRSAGFADTEGQLSLCRPPG